MKRIAVVGSNGHIARKHIKAIESIPGLLLAATCDSTGKADYTNHRELFVRKDIDLVVICTPNFTHFQIAREFLEQGFAVLIEKPVAMEVNEAIELSRYPKAFAVLQLRYGDIIQDILQIESGEIYSMSLRIHWNRDAKYFQGWRGIRHQDGGILLNQGIHYLDLIHQIATRGKAMDVYGYGLGSTLAHDIETEDQFVGCLKFANGILASIDISLNNLGDSSCGLTVLHKYGSDQFWFDAWSFVPMYQAILEDQCLVVKDALPSLRLVELLSQKGVKTWIP